MSQTILQIAEQNGMNIDAVRRRWDRANLSERFGKFSRYAIPNAEQYAILFGGQKAERIAEKKSEQVPVLSVYEQPKSTPVAAPEKSRVVAPREKQFAPSKTETLQARKYEGISWAFDIIAVAIVAGHAGLIWYDASVLWGMAGNIGGGIAFFVVLLALIIAVDDRRPRTSEYAMWFVCVVDIGAWFVHTPAFMQYAKADATLTGWFCAAICTLSFMALYLFRDSKLA